MKPDDDRPEPPAEVAADGGSDGQRLEPDDGRDSESDTDEEDEDGEDEEEDEDEDGEDGEEGNDGVDLVEGDEEGTTETVDDEETEEEDEDDASSDDDDKEDILNGPLGSPSAPHCYICLNGFEGQDIGSPDPCDGQHHFCLECIEEWSKQINTCPVDRKSFSFIVVRRKINGNITMKLPVIANKIPDLTDVTDDDLTYCEICGRCDREDRLLLCDGCDFGYHCDCLSPPLDTIPIEEWFCPDCHRQMFGDANPSGNPPAMANGHRRRNIARTGAFEAVRQRIASRRVGQPISGGSSQRSNTQRSGSTSRSGSISRTASTSRAGSSRSGSTARSTPRKKKPAAKRRRRKTTKRKTGKTRKRKTTTRRRTTTKTGKRRKRRTKRKTKKRKSRKSRHSLRPLPPPSTVRTRIATRLGLGPPPISPYGLPAMKGYQSSSSSTSSRQLNQPLSLFGRELANHDPRILPEDDDDRYDDFPSLVSGQLGLMARPRVSSIPLAPAKPKEADQGNQDILAEILSSQERLYTPSCDVTISRDGTLLHRPNRSSVTNKPNSRSLSSTGSSTKSSPSSSPPRTFTDFFHPNILEPVPLIKPSPGDSLAKEEGAAGDGKVELYSDIESIGDGADSEAGELVIDEDDDGGHQQKDGGDKQEVGHQQDGHHDDGQSDEDYQAESHQVDGQSFSESVISDAQPMDVDQDKDQEQKPDDVSNNQNKDVFEPSSEEEDDRIDDLVNKKPTKLLVKMPMKILLKKDKERIAEEEAKLKKAEEEERKLKEAEEELSKSKELKEDQSHDDLRLFVDHNDPDDDIDKESDLDIDKELDLEPSPKDVDDDDFQLVKTTAKPIAATSSSTDKKEDREIDETKVRRCRHGKIINKKSSSDHHHQKSHHKKVTESRSRSRESKKARLDEDRHRDDGDDKKDSFGWKKLSSSSKNRSYRDGKPKAEETLFREKEGLVKKKKKKDDKERQRTRPKEERRRKASDIKEPVRESIKEHIKDPVESSSSSKRKKKRQDEEDTSDRRGHRHSESDKRRHHHHHHHRKRHKTDRDSSLKRHRKQSTSSRTSRFDDDDDDDDAVMTAGMATKILQGSHGSYHDVTPLDSKEIYAEGDRIVINVSFKKESTKKSDVEPSDSKSEDAKSSATEEPSPAKSRIKRDMIWSPQTTATTSKEEPDQKDQKDKPKDKDGQLRFLPRSLQQDKDKTTSGPTHGPHTPDGEYKINGDEEEDDDEDDDDDDDRPTPTQDESPSSTMQSPSMSSDGARSPRSPADSSNSLDVYDPEAPLTSPSDQKPEPVRPETRPVLSRTTSRSELTNNQITSDSTVRRSSPRRTSSPKELPRPTRTAQEPSATSSSSQLTASISSNQLSTRKTSPFKSPQKKKSPHKQPVTSSVTTTTTTTTQPILGLPPTNLFRPSGAAALAAIASLNSSNLAQLLQMAQTLKNTSLKKSASGPSQVITTTAPSQPGARDVTELVDMDMSSPSPPQVTSSTSSSRMSSSALTVKSLWDSLVKGQPPPGGKTTAGSGAGGGHRKSAQGDKKKDNSSAFTAVKHRHPHHHVNVSSADAKKPPNKLDHLTVLDDVPSSAVEMAVKEKFIKKLNRQERVIEEVKLVLKPYYQRRDVSKEEYKEILRKSVPKICHSKSGEINPVKIKSLVEGYIKRFKYLRKKSKK